MSIRWTFSLTLGLLAVGGTASAQSGHSHPGGVGGGPVPIFPTPGGSDGRYAQSPGAHRPSDPRRRRDPGEADAADRRHRTLRNRRWCRPLIPVCPPLYDYVLPPIVVVPDPGYYDPGPPPIGVRPLDGPAGLARPGLRRRGTAPASRDGRTMAGPPREAGEAERPGAVESARHDRRPPLPRGEYATRRRALRAGGPRRPERGGPPHRPGAARAGTRRLRRGGPPHPRGADRPARLADPRPRHQRRPTASPPTSPRRSPSWNRTSRPTPPTATPGSSWARSGISRARPGGRPTSSSASPTASPTPRSRPSSTPPLRRTRRTDRSSAGPPPAEAPRSDARTATLLCRRLPDRPALPARPPRDRRAGRAPAGHDRPRRRRLRAVLRREAGRLPRVRPRRPDLRDRRGAARPAGRRRSPTSTPTATQRKAQRAGRLHPDRHVPGSRPEVARAWSSTRPA